MENILYLNFLKSQNRSKEFNNIQALKMFQMSKFLFAQDKT